MTHSYATAHSVLLLLLAPVSCALAQAPTITAVIPMANAGAVARTSPVTVSFSQPLTAGSAAALKVYSAQRGGLRTRTTTPATVSGNNLVFTPATPFMPGETVKYTVTTAAASAGGSLAQARVGQFTAAVGGGTGLFSGGGDFTFGNRPEGIALGDLDNDGDLDLLLANTASFVGRSISVRMNNGNGSFSGSQEVPTGYGPWRIALGDLDDDGDLDLVTSYPGGPSVSIRMNNGNGVFGNGQELIIGSVIGSGPGIALGDVDGDGDLDLVTTPGAGPQNTSNVLVCINNGSGIFSPATTVGVGIFPTRLALADVDNDGDVDLLAQNQNSSTVSVRLNNGSGTFTGTQEVGVGSTPFDMTINDVDSDGDLDILTASFNSRSVSIRLNNGSGTFSGTQEVATRGNPLSLAVADLDGDNDADLLVARNDDSVSVQLNSGGIFRKTQSLRVTTTPYELAVGDIDNDGDLDFLATSWFSSVTSIRFNSNTTLATTPKNLTAALAIYPNPARHAITITGATPHAPCQVHDALGRVVLTATADATGTARLAFPESMAAGTYLVRSNEQTRRLLVE